MRPADRAQDITRIPGEAAVPDARPSPDAPRATRPDPLRQRLDNLPPGHPSSPYDTPHHQEPHSRDLGAPDLRKDRPPDQERPADQSHPFTDAEWTDHVADVRVKLEDAEGLATDRQFTNDPDREQWSPDRNRLHGQLVTDFYQQAESVPQERSAIIIGGLGGAGKSTILEKHAGIELSQYVVVNPDKVKEHMATRGLIPVVEGLSPMEASDLVHEESSVVAKQLAHRAVGDGKNLIWDITMSTRESTEQRISDLRSAGYSISGIFVDIPVELSVSRADSRHRDGEDDLRAGKGLGGRYVPPEVIRAQFDEDWQSKNRKTFEEVKSSFNSWSRYDNSVDHQPAQLIEMSKSNDES